MSYGTVGYLNVELSKRDPVASVSCLESMGVVGDPMSAFSGVANADDKTRPKTDNDRREICVHGML